MPTELSQKELKKHLLYNPETGIFLVKIPEFKYGFHVNHGENV